MRPLHSSLALLIVLIAVVVPAVIALDVVAADEDENEIEDDDDVGDASSSCSSGATGSASSVVVRGADGRLATHTLIDLQIRMGDTVCYRFSPDEDGGGDGEGGFIRISYLGLSSVYNVLNAYDFSLAAADVRCLCNCPGGANTCDADTQSCPYAPSTSTCVNFYRATTSATGCFWNFLGLSASLCCSISIKPDDRDHRGGRTYRAVELAVPRLVARLKVSHLDSQGGEISSRSEHIDLQKAHGLDLGPTLSLHFEGSAASSWLPAGWYFAPQRSRHALFGNVPINGLNEWNVHKLGWLKHDRVSRMSSIRSAEWQLLNSMEVTVEDCSMNTYSSVGFPTPFLSSSSLSSMKERNQTESARPLSEMFPFISRISHRRRHVRVEHRGAPPISVTFRHSSAVSVVLVHPEPPSLLGGFDGVMSMDVSSNLHLNLTLFNVTGTVFGSVPAGNGSQFTFQMSFNTTAGRPMARAFHRVDLPGGGGEGGSHCLGALVKLRPKNAGGSVVKRVPCVERGLDNFSAPLPPPPPLLRSSHSLAFAPAAPSVTRLSQHNAADCLWCPDSWSFWMNPLNWSGGVWNLTRAVVTVVVLLVACSVIFCCLKISCCCCHKML